MSDTRQADGAVAHHRLAELPPTRWSVIGAARHADADTRVRALEEIVTLYRPVLVQFLVSRLRLSVERAEDFTHAFFVEKLLRRNLALEASPEKGRFRSFILKVFSNFVRSRLREERAAKRRPDSPDAECLDDLPALLCANPPPVSEAFDVLWARQLLGRTIERIQGECLAKQRQDLWLVLEDRILGPILDNRPPTPYEQFVVRFGLHSPSEAANLLITAKRMFIRVLRQTVRETVLDERDVEPEILELRRILKS